MSVIIKEEVVNHPNPESPINKKDVPSNLSALDLENFENNCLQQENLNTQFDIAHEEILQSKSGIIEGSQLKNNIKDEVSEATEDESMAVEALWQLGGGGYSEKEKSLNKNEEGNIELEPVRYPVIKSTFTIMQCENCPHSFATESEMNAHQPLCEGRVKNNYNCSICSAYFDSKMNYDNHIICHEVARPFSCRSCGCLFKLKQEYQSHTCLQMLRNLQCSLCGMEFSRASSLTNHMKVHSYIPGRALTELPPLAAEPALIEPGFSNNWSHDTQTLPPLLPQLDISSSNYFNQSSTDISSWNMNLGLPDSLTNEDLADSMDIAQEMTVNTTYLNVLNRQPPSFPNEFDPINVSEESLEYNRQTPESDKIPSSKLQQPNNDFIDPIKSLVKVENFPLDPIKESNTTSTTEVQNDVISKKKPHSCRYCGVAFTRAKALVSHERLHQDYLSEFVECSKCGDVFTDNHYLKNHICKTNTSSKDKQNTQQKTSTKTSPISDSNETIESPSLEGTLDDKYSADEDAEQVSPTSDFAKQKLNKHACRHCSKRFTTKQKMYRHMWIHREKTFSCEICGETFSLQNELDSHRLSSHPSNTPHSCPVCGKSFASRQGLWEHTRSHREGVAPHTCSLCGKSFSSRQGFLIHTRTHTGERPYGCRYCWKAFRDGGTLRKHERIHTGERPHVCPLCWRAFNQKVVLREHVRWVHAAPSGAAEPPLACPLCPQLLPDKEDLCAHIVKHSDILAAKEKQKQIDSQKSSPALLTVKKDLIDKRKNNLVQEQPVVTNNKSFVCTELPEKSPEELTSNFTCDLCNHVFLTRHQLLSHVRIHI